MGSAFTHHQGSGSRAGDSGGLVWDLIVLLGHVLASSLSEIPLSPRHLIEGEPDTFLDHRDQRGFSWGNPPISFLILVPSPHTFRMSKL